MLTLWMWKVIGEQGFTSLVEAFGQAATAGEHVQSAIFGEFEAGLFVLGVLRFLGSRCLPFAFTLKKDVAAGIRILCSEF